MHARGYDLRQNAIVGVFLRLMEYYRGIMVLTTNKINEDGSDDIDDAILSRCSLVVHYEIPNGKGHYKIWRDQREIRKITVEELPDPVLKVLAARFHISGRSIRNLLGLTARFARANKLKMGPELFQTISKYIPTTRSEKVLKKEDADKIVVE